jgi:hypothetical protein
MPIGLTTCISIYLVFFFFSPLFITLLLTSITFFFYHIGCAQDKKLSNFLHDAFISEHRCTYRETKKKLLLLKGGMVEMANKLARQVEGSCEKKVSKTDGIVGASVECAHLSVRMMSRNDSKFQIDSNEPPIVTTEEDHTGYSDDEFDPFHDEFENTAKHTVEHTELINIEDEGDEESEHPNERYEEDVVVTDTDASCPVLEYELLTEASLCKLSRTMEKRRPKRARRMKTRIQHYDRNEHMDGETVEAPEPLDIDELERQLLSIIQSQDPETN